MVVDRDSDDKQNIALRYQLGVSTPAPGRSRATVGRAEHDRYGLTLTTDSPEAAAAYRHGVDLMLSSNGGAAEWLNRAVEADPGFALAHAALSRIHQLIGPRAEAVRLADLAIELASSATEREREHATIQRLLVGGQTAEALTRIKAHVAHHPLDALALAPASSVFGLIGFSGRNGRESEQLDLLAPLADAYGDDWWFNAVLAFALVETGRWERGRELVERSIEQKPDSAQAAHVLAHASYEGGDNEAAHDFLQSWLPGLDPISPLHCHLWWHFCLVLLTGGDAEAAAAVYAERCTPAVSVSPPLNIVTDGASLLWRSELAGSATDRDRWRAIDECYRQRFDGPATFVDVHAVLPPIVLGLTDRVEEHLAAVARLDAEGKLAAGPVTLVMARAFQAYVEQRWDDVIELLGPELPEVVRIGGSRAQRDLALNTVLAAYGRAGRWSEAEALLAADPDRQAVHPVGHPSPAPSRLG